MTSSTPPLPSSALPTLAARADHELLEAAKHLNMLEDFVARESRNNPGPGWGAVVDMLIRDREALESELRNRRLL